MHYPMGDSCPTLRVDCTVSGLQGLADLYAWLDDSAVLTDDKLPGMKNIHLVVADLFLPRDFAAEVCAGLRLPALEKILARGEAETHQAVSLEDALCTLFSAHSLSGIAPISAAFDGLEPGCWLRADPVHVRLQREQVVLLPNVAISLEEAQRFCVSLNEHFAAEGLTFFAPDPIRWYVRLDALPDMTTVPLSQAAGRNIHGNLPAGADARHWHQLFNEIQMLLFAHPLNEAREARGEVPVNSVWFWGGGAEVNVSPPCNSASSDEVLVKMLATAAGVPFSQWQPVWHVGDELLVWTGLRSALQRGDFAAWRSALQDFETGYAWPLWQALCKGQIARLQVDILGGDSLRKIRLTRGDSWAFWRRTRRLADYSVESTNG